MSLYLPGLTGRIDQEFLILIGALLFLMWIALILIVATILREEWT